MAGHRVSGLGRGATSPAAGWVRRGPLPRAAWFRPPGRKASSRAWRSALGDQHLIYTKALSASVTRVLRAVHAWTAKQSCSTANSGRLDAGRTWSRPEPGGRRRHEGLSAATVGEDTHTRDTPIRRQESTSPSGFRDGPPRHRLLLFCTAESQRR